MSVSLFRWTDECEQDPMCVGDCDLCRKETMIDKYDEVGIPLLEKVSQSKAKPAEECIYPKCEKCDKYHGHYCTVPIVVSKQMLYIIEERLNILESKVRRLDALITEEIMQTKPRRTNAVEETNFTWDDYFRKENQ